MFLVEATAPLDDQWEERDADILTAAGRKSDGSGASGKSMGGVSCREHHWYVPDFAEANRMRHALLAVPKVYATIREHTSPV